VLIKEQRTQVVLQERKATSVISFHFLIKEYQDFPEVSPVSLVTTETTSSILHYFVKNRKKLFIKFNTICYCSAGT